MIRLRSCAPLVLALAASLPAGEAPPAVPALASGLALVALPAGEDLAAARALASGGDVLVHVVRPAWPTLDADRARLVDDGFGGRITLAAAPLETALQPDSATLLLAAGDAPAAADRLVHPGGTVVRGGRATTRPWDPALDDWSHYFYDAAANPVSKDTKVAPPRGVQWQTGPNATGMNDNVVRVSRGHMTYHVPAGRQRLLLVGRNAFNGLPRFLRPVAGGLQRTWPLVTTEDAIYTFTELVRHPTPANAPAGAGRLAAFDPRTGAELRRFDHIIGQSAEGERSGVIIADLIVHGDLLITADASALTATDRRSGAVRWRHAVSGGGVPAMPCVDAARQQVVFIEADTGRMDRGRVRNVDARAFAAIGLADGRPRWRTPVEGDLLRRQISQLFATPDRLFFYRAGGFGAVKDRGRGDSLTLGALDPASGRVLWHHSGFHKGPTYDHPQPGDWVIPHQQTLEAAFVRGQIHLMSHGVVTFDPAAGTLGQVWNVGNLACDASRATESMLLVGYGAWFDLRGPAMLGTRNELTRGGCASGVVPAHGMVFGVPNRCRCSRVLKGYLALTVAEPPTPIADGERLQRLAGAAASAGGAPAATDWPAFLGSSQRDAANASPVPRAPAEAWSARLGAAPSASGAIVQDWRLNSMFNGWISAPVAADGTVAVAEPWAHRVHTVDLATGQRRWTWTGGARIDAPPAWHAGGWLIADRAGTVHRLDAQGRGQWRFLAARDHRRMVGWSQLESVHPTIGGVTLVGGTAVVVAGRHPEADGGILAWGLDALTGAPRWSRTLARTRPWVKATESINVPDPVGTLRNHGNSVLNGVGVAEGAAVGIPGWWFDAATGRPTADVPARAPSRRRGRDAEAPNVLPDAVAATAAVVLSFIERDPVGSGQLDDYGGPGHHEGLSSLTVRSSGFSVGGLAFAYRLPRAVVAQFEGSSISGFDTTQREARKPHWQVRRPGAQYIAVAFGADAVVAGFTQVNDNDRAAPRAGGFQVIDPASGTVLATVELPSAPIANGIALASGRILVACEDGTLRCWR